MNGASLLYGNATSPGVPIPKELNDVIPEVFKACTDFGLKYYPTVIQMLTYDEMSEICSYGGFVSRYPHWRFGAAYEEMQRGYEFGLHKVYEIVTNVNPCHIYCLNSNSLLDNITVIAHALGHNHFFKNNLFFKHTNTDAMNFLANHGTRIRRYISRYGKEKVTEFMDHVLRIETLIDHSKAWETKTIKEKNIIDKKHYDYPRRINVQPNHEYMDRYINTKDYMDYEHKRIEDNEKRKDLGIVSMKNKDILCYIKDNVALKPWQSDIIGMMYEEALYFAPQGMTKVANEGFASWTDYNIIAKQGLCALGQKSHCDGIIDYSLHKMGVLGGKYSMNPYKLGFNLLSDIEERWNKGQFGREWEDCDDMRVKEKWNHNLNLGKDKVFEVCEYYDDINLINEFFTQDFCNKYNFFEWKRYPNGEYKIESKDSNRIKKKLIAKYINRGLPDIRLVDPNHKGRGVWLLEHQWDGRTLDESYTKEVLASLNFIIRAPIILASKNKNEEDIVFNCQNPESEYIQVLSKEDYLRKWEKY